MVFIFLKSSLFLVRCTNIPNNSIHSFWQQFQHIFNDYLINLDLNLNSNNNLPQIIEVYGSRW